MADKRVIELIEKEKVNNNDYLIVDDAIDGTKKAKVSTLVETAKETVSEFKLTNTFEGSALAKTIYGMSVQDGTPTPSSPVEIKSAKADFRIKSKNIIPPPPYTDGNSFTHNGVTFTTKEDGSIVANGTATSTGAIFRVFQGTLEKTALGVVYISGCPSGGAEDKYYLQASFWGNNTIWYKGQKDYGSGASLTPPDDGKLAIVRIVIASGQVCNNLVFKPMVSMADGTEFETGKRTLISTDITLRAIEVTSSDSYNLVKDGKYYIADTLEWSEEKGYQIKRKVGRYVVDGTETGWETGSGNQSSYGWSWRLPNYANYFKHIKVAVGNVRDFVTDYLKCKQYNSAPIYTPDSTEDWGSGTYRTANNVWISLGASDMSILSITDTATFKTWLGLHNIEFLYPCDEYTETITPEQALSLLSLKTYDVATSIDGIGDVAPVIELHYAKNEISAKALTGHNEGFKAQEINNLYGVKNVLPYPYFETTKTEYGITFTDNGDGTVTLNGTATGTARFWLCQPQLSNLNPDAYYIMTGVPSDSHWTNYGSNVSTYCIYTSGNTFYWTNENHPIMKGDTTYGGIAIVVNQGVVCNNVVFKPMLRLATIQDDSYTEYAMSNRELTLKVQELEALIEAMS